VGDENEKLIVIRKSASSWLNMSVAGASLAGAAALHSWPILAVGVCAYGAMVAWDLVSPDFRRRALATSNTDALGDPKAFKDPQARAVVSSIRDAHAALEGVLEETPEELKANLVLALSSASELVQRGSALARRLEDLARYLATTDPRAMQTDLQALAERAQSASDPEARAQYESARAARAEHLAALTDLMTARERIGATLLSITATLEGMPAKVVRLRTLDAQAADRLTGDVKEELDRMNVEIRSFEETLGTLLEVRS
jgi:hypothetical protein